MSTREPGPVSPDESPQEQQRQGPQETAHADESEAPAAAPPRAGRRTRVSGVWTAVAVGAVLLILLLIFILQNLQTVDVTYFGASGELPLGVAVLLAAAVGALLVLMVGAARILQLRTSARRERRRNKKVSPARE